MELQIPARNLKLFAKGLACLSKIGPEMMLETLDDGVRKGSTKVRSFPPFGLSHKQ